MFTFSTFVKNGFLNTALFISKQIISSKNRGISRPIIRIAIISIALGIAVMIAAVAIVTGFQTEISNKVIGFGSHIQISNYDNNLSYELAPVSKQQDFYSWMDTIEGIDHIQVFANKAGIIKTDDQIQGVVLKGIGGDYHWDFFQGRIKQGVPIQLNDSITTMGVLISSSLASLMKLKLGDPLRMYFVSGNQSQTRGRKFYIEGIYETGLEEFDKLFIIGDIKHIQKLNRWEEDQVSGFEVFIDDYNDLDRMASYVFNNISYELDARTIVDLYPQMFDWLALQDMNVVIILVLMVIVAGITMISTLLILILERTNMIGILKALGARTLTIRQIFLIQATYIIGLGLLWGNLVGIGLCLLQYYTGIIGLPQESYYVSVVPVILKTWHIVLINLGTLLVCTLILIVPSYIVARITPVKAIRMS